MAIGDEVDVFLHHDSEDRLLATTLNPVAELMQVAGFQVVGVRGGVGAFLDWGLEKDLLLPLREQTQTPQMGDWVVAMVVLDDVSGRLMATMRFAKHLNLTEPDFAEGEKVEVVVAEETELGYKAVIRHAHWGLLYKNEIPSPLVPGDEMDAFVRKIRPDGKIDLSVDEAGYQRVKPLRDHILEALRAAGGRLPLDDKTPPEVIRAQFQTSKKAFKQALGGLFRARRIEFVEGGIALLPPKS
jgi:predicted RNA-binding protein (virulence factor B family)